MLALSRQDVYQLVPMRTAIELMKQVFRDLSAGQTVSPLRTPIEVPDVSGVTLFMPAYVPSAPGLGVKVVSVFPNNRALRKPTIHAIVVLVDTTTGEPVAVLDGTYLTALRTGAASGAATDLLARPDARVLTCIGAGAQGPTQAWAVTCVRPIETIYVYDINQDAVASFEQRLRQLGFIYVGIGRDSLSFKPMDGQQPQGLAYRDGAQDLSSLAAGNKPGQGTP